MVRTRQSAAAAQQNESANNDGEIADKRERKPKRGVARKTAQIVTARSLGKRTRGEAEPDAPRQKRPATKRTVVDEHEDEVPRDPMFFEAINNRVAGKTSAKGKASARKNEQLSKERRKPRVDEVAEAREGDAAVRDSQEDKVAEAQYEDDTAQESQAEENGEDIEAEDDHESDMFVQQEDEDDGEEAERQLHEEEQADDDDSVQEIPQSSRTRNLEHIASVDVISTDMTYIEPEPQGASPLVFSLDCDGLNTIIADMGKRGWMNEKGEWADELLQNEEEFETETETQWQTRHSEVIKTKNCMKLFLGVMELYQNCKDMPNAPALDEQAEFLRTHSQEIQKNLKQVRNVTRQIKNQASKSIQGNSKQNTAEHQRRKELWTCIYKRLIPVLVLALKEALLLGGYSRYETKPETISGKDGRFMACTLQFAVRIVGFIDQLYTLVMQHLATEEDTENKVHKAMRSHRRAFANHFRVLQPRVLAGMQELKRRAEAPVRQIEMAERSLRAREAQEESDRIIREKQDRQMMLFIASTHRVRERPPPPPRDEYYEKHGWRMWEDEILLGVIRKTKSPNLAVLARQIPGRSTVQVIDRVGELRELMKAKYEAAGVPPPKWCFQHRT